MTRFQILLVRVGPKRTTIVSVLTLSVITTLTTTVTTKIALIDTIVVTDLVDVGIRIIVVVIRIRSSLALTGATVRVSLIVRVSIMIRHQGLVPNGMAPRLNIVPLACSCISQSMRLAPGELERCFNDFAKLGAQTNSPGLRYRETNCNSLGTLVAVEATSNLVQATSNLVPGLVPVAPVILIPPPLGLAPADSRGRLPLREIVDECGRSIADGLARLVLDAPDFVLVTDIFQLLTGVFVAMDLDGSVRMNDLRYDIGRWSANLEADGVRSAFAALDECSVLWRLGVVQPDSKGRGIADCNKSQS